MSKAIAILGDSSSSSLGGDKITYPSILYQLIKPYGCCVYNYAVPGLTASDAKALYHDVIKKNKVDCLVLYLGNNEACYSSKKGYTPTFLLKIKNLFRQSTKSKMHRFYSRFETKFRFTYDYFRQEIANTPKEFSKNIASIVRSAKRRKIKLIFINPIANFEYFAGAGLPNYLFFKLIGIDDSVSEKLQPCDFSSEQLIKGIGLQERKQYLEMIECYEQLIASKPDPLITLIANNNLAIYYGCRDKEKSQKILMNLIGQCPNYDAIIYYNLYLLNNNNNEDNEDDQNSLNNQFLKNAYEKDRSLYRIKDEYRLEINSIADTNRVCLLDLKHLLNKKNFIDYCHPDKLGHQKIARAIAECLTLDAEQQMIAGIDCPHEKRKIFKKEEVDFIGSTFMKEILTSPNYSTSPNQNYVDYYYIDDQFSALEIKNALSNLIKKRKLIDIPALKKIAWLERTHLEKCLIHFLISNARHPIFNDALNIGEDMLPMSHEILLMPENYLSRLLYGYFDFFEKHVMKKVNCLDGFSQFGIKKSDFYNNIILRNNKGQLPVHLNFSMSYFQEIQKKLFHFILEQDLFSNVILQRKREIIFWYTREAFRYGTQSRLTMLYNRLSIDYSIESIVILMTIAFRRGFNAFIKSLLPVLAFLQQLIRVHEFYILSYCNNPKTSFLEYESALQLIEQKIKQAVMDVASSVNQVSLKTE